MHNQTVYFSSNFTEQLNAIERAKDAYISLLNSIKKYVDDKEKIDIFHRHITEKLLSVFRQLELNYRVCVYCDKCGMPISTFLDFETLTRFYYCDFCNAIIVQTFLKDLEVFANRELSKISQAIQIASKELPLPEDQCEIPQEELEQAERLIASE